MAITVQDLFQYLQIPPFNRASGIALANALLSSMPKDAGPSVMQAATGIRGCVGAIEKGWTDRDRSALSADGTESIQADQMVDAAWSAMRDNLFGLARLPRDRYPRAARAAQIYEALFGSGLGFLKLSFDQEWAHSNTLLQRIDTDGLATEIDQLIGPEFLSEVRLAHQHYGEVLGKTKARRQAAEDANFSQLLRNLSESMRGYALQVVASADPSRPESLAAAQKALEPIDLERRARRKGRGGTKPATTTPGNDNPTGPTE